MTFATFSRSFAEVFIKQHFAVQHLTVCSLLLSSCCMNCLQPIANATLPPFGGADAHGFGGAITTTTITVTISPVRPVVFA